MSVGIHPHLVELSVTEQQLKHDTAERPQVDFTRGVVRVSQHLGGEEAGRADKVVHDPVVRLPHDSAQPEVAQPQVGPSGGGIVLQEQVLVAEEGRARAEAQQGEGQAR